MTSYVRSQEKSTKPVTKRVGRHGLPVHGHAHGHERNAHGHHRHDHEL